MDQTVHSDDALTRATDRLIARLAADPGVVVTGLRETLGRG